MGSRKGSAFERLISTKLSLWWSAGERDDLVWRTSASGGRATSRAKRGKTTRNHCGDLCATDACIECLFKLVTFELKSGYNSVTPTDLIDCDRPSTGNKKAPRFGDFVRQAEEAAGRAGTPYWMLVHRRDKRKDMVYIPESLFYKLGFYSRNKPSSACVFGKQEIGIIRLDDFLDQVKPDDIRKLARRVSHG